MYPRIYLDHASTSTLRPAARQAMIEWLWCADPGRVHTEGAMARAALEDARGAVAELFGTRPRQVVFTSGATEAVNSATYAALAPHPPSTAVLSAVEHSCVREATERWAATVVTVPVDAAGRVDPASVAGALGRGPVALVHCQLANHEVGTIQPVAEIAELCRRHGALIHVDAATAAGHLPVAFDELGADLVSVTAHKLGGPKGVGALILRRGLRLAPFILGGAQERGRRGGIENVAAAAGFGAVAAELCRPGALGAEAERAARLTGRLLEAAAAVDGVSLYGPADPAGRVPHLLCLGVEGVEAEPVLIGLDQRGVAAHSGSSCSSEALESSPVLEAMGVDADHSLRFSVGWDTTPEDVAAAGPAFADVVARLRRLRADPPPAPTW